MVEIFGDLRPIQGSDDSRILQLESVAKWFLEWEESVQCSGMNKKDQRAALMTQETRDDTLSVLFGFKELCLNHFHSSPLSIVPGRINSDICENVFCQQRAMCHGANDNPSHDQYTHGLNTIILSQAPISRKSNAFGSCDPLSFPCAKKAKFE